MQRQKNNLKFKIVQISSEDQDYPASELLNPSQKSRGWQSQRNCQYPQMLTIQFLNPVIVHSLAYLSHHYKIASSVSLQICFDQNQNYHQMKFRKVGKFILSNNEHNDYRSRELKTVFIDTPAFFLKIILNEPYQNSLNIFNQVGVVGIQFFGENISQPNIPQPVQNMVMNQANKEDNINDLMQSLMMQKQQTLITQDYQSAQVIQNQLDQLMQVQQQILVLEQQKNMAVQNNDFDQAIAIVEQIKKIKTLQNVQSQSIRSSQAQLNIPMNQYQQSSSQFTPNQNNIEQQYQQQTDEIQQEDVQQQDNNMSGKRSGRVRRHYKRNRSKKEEQSIQEEIGQEDSQYQVDEQQERQEYVDDRPLPTQQKNNEQQLKEFPTDEENDQQIDPNDIVLTKKQQQQMQQFVGTFQDNFLKQYFCSQWTYKQEACEKIMSYLKNSNSIKNVPNSFIETSNWSFAISQLWLLGLDFVSNSVPKIKQNGLDIIQQIVELIATQQINLKSHYDQMMQQGNVILLKQTQELKNDKSIEQLSGIFVCLIQTKMIDRNNFIEQLSQDKNGKKKLNIKELISRCKFLGSIILDIKINQNQVDQILSFGQKCLENSNKQVRNSATILMVALKDKFGMDKLLSYFEQSNLRRPLYEELLKNLQKPSKKNSKVSKKKSQSYEDEEEQQIQEEYKEDEQIEQIVEQEYDQNFQEVIQQEPEEDSEFCNFCQRINKNELTDEQYDMHLWKECPMLMFCEFCQQVVEVSEFNTHLLNECKESDFFSKCPRCQNSIMNDEIEQHLEEMGCKVLRINQGYQRCPLCQLDLMINPEDPDDTWRNHLVVHGCPKNDRTNQQFKIKIIYLFCSYLQVIIDIFLIFFNHYD